MLDRAWPSSIANNSERGLPPCRLPGGETPDRKFETSDMISAMSGTYLSMVAAAGQIQCHLSCNSPVPGPEVSNQEAGTKWADLSKPANGILQV